MKSMQKGFTLIELMIVVAIIAILAAIAIPAYQNYLIRTQVTEGVTLMDGAKVGMTEYHANHAAWPASNQSAGVESPASIAGKYVASVTIGASNGVITAKFGGTTPNAAIQNKTISLTGTTGSATGTVIAWTCTGGKTGTPVDPKYLPSTCR
jgi:type IV pilus assembly protein PilA